jgi:hypothetical protein
MAYRYHQHVKHALSTLHLVCHVLVHGKRDFRPSGILLCPVWEFEVLADLGARARAKQSLEAGIADDRG